MRYWMLSAVLVFTSLATVRAGDLLERNIAGKYAASGVGVGGKAYAATVTITQNGDTYLIHWAFDDAGFDGVGIVKGDALSVGWTNHDKAGVVIYTLHAGTLDGVWADGSTNGKTYTETLKKQP